ncbi:MAG: alcohol dehydrogenase catalytic domain-containing protein [Clostridia bacterium]|nr:alcohol dehydrogenase catalytic domain-containing protein [Clostridia bacterium]
MKAVQIKRPGVVELIEAPIPDVPAGFARIKVLAAAVCATDLEVIDGKIPANYPLIPGHEWSGIVESVGSSEDSKWVGKSVIGSNDVVCLKCDACRSGNWRYCREFEEIGFKRNGAYAEYVIAPVYGLCEKPDNVPFETAALCEPLGVALGTLEKASAKFGQTLVIIGAGSIGLCMLSAAKAMGMRKIVVVAASEKRLELARKMGAYATISTANQDIFEELKRIHPDGTDVVIEATGIESCIQTSLKITRKGGTIALAGYGRGANMTIRVDDIHINNLHVVGAGNNWNQHKNAMMLMADGIIDLSPLVTETMPLEDFAKAIDMARTRPHGFIKAIFKF